MTDPLQRRPLNVHSAREGMVTLGKIGVETHAVAVDPDVHDVASDEHGGDHDLVAADATPLLESP